MLRDRDFKMVRVLLGNMNYLLHGIMSDPASGMFTVLGRGVSGKWATWRYNPDTKDLHNGHYDLSTDEALTDVRDRL